MRDPVDIDLIQHENDCERIDDRDELANKADSANDEVPTAAEQDRMIADSQNEELTFEETKRAAAAAYSAQFIGVGALWALRGVK